MSTASVLQLIAPPHTGLSLQLYSFLPCAIYSPLLYSYIHWHGVHLLTCHIGTLFIAQVKPESSVVVAGLLGGGGYPQGNSQCHAVFVS